MNSSSFEMPWTEAVQRDYPLMKTILRGSPSLWTNIRALFLPLSLADEDLGYSVSIKDLPLKRFLLELKGHGFSFCIANGTGLRACIPMLRVSGPHLGSRFIEFTFGDEGSHQPHGLFSLMQGMRNFEKEHPYLGVSGEDGEWQESSRYGE